MSSKKLTYAFVGVLALAMGVMFSQRWIIPLMSKDAKNFVPIRYYANTQNDDYFYYARIREVLNGTLFAGDHATYEYKNVYTPHATYTVSFIAGAVGGILSGKTDDAYYFNYFVFPAISFLLLVWIGSALGIHSVLAAALAIIAMLTADNIARTPNILLTGPFLYLFALLVFVKLEVKNPARWLDFLLALILGLSSVTSVANMFVCYGIFITCWAFQFNTNLNHRGFLKIFILAFVISIPGFFLILTSVMGQNPDWYNLAIPPLDQYVGIKDRFFIPAIKMVLNPAVVALYFLSYRHKRFIAGILFGMTLTYCALLALKGSFTASYVLNRGGEVLFNFTWGAGLLIWILGVLRDGEVSVSFYKWRHSLCHFPRMKMVSGFLQIIFVATLLLGAASIAKKANRYMRKEANARIPHYFDSQFRDLADWGQKFGAKNQVIVSLDFDVISNLGIYAPWDTYFAFAHHSPVPTPERCKRFYEVLAFYGVNIETFKDNLLQMKSHEKLSLYQNDQDIQSGLMQLIMFYGKYTDYPMSRPEIDAMVRDYSSVKDQFNGFSYKADYIIFSSHTSRWGLPLGRAEALIKNNLPVYKSGAYQIYRL